MNNNRYNLIIVKFYIAKAGSEGGDDTLLYLSLDTAHSVYSF